jgi:glycosyltransferase involved in cell wall biosynthesis
VRVLQVDSGRVWRGGQNQVRLVARELARRAVVEQRLVTKGGSELARRAAADGVRVREVPWAMGLDPRAGWRLVVEALDFRPDLIHAHDGHAIGLAVWARRFLSWQGAEPTPRVIATHRVVFPLRARTSLHGADLVIAISEAVKTSLVAGGVPAARIRVVPSGVDPDEVRQAAAAPLGIRAALGLPERTPLAANVGALEAAKDQRTLVSAAAHARGDRPELHWVIAGEGDQRPALEAAIRALGVGDRVHLLGHVDRPEALLREADVCVMCSSAEGLGSVVLQALALGKPVVATRAGGLPEVVPPAWLVAVGDGEGLARKVVAALDHPSPLPLPRQFTVSAMADAVLAVYTSLI